MIKQRTGAQNKGIIYIENVRNFVVYCFKGVFFFIVQLRYVLSVAHRPVGHSKMLRNRAITQAFIQAILSTAVFRQRFGFFTSCLVNYLREVLPWLAPKGTFLKFSSPYYWKCISNTLSDCRS